MLNLVQKHDGKHYPKLSWTPPYKASTCNYPKLKEKKIEVTVTTRLYARNIDHNKEQFQNLM